MYDSDRDIYYVCARMKPTREEFDRVTAVMNCKKCFGRGAVGWLENGEPVLCTCMRKVRSHFERVVPLESKDQQERVVG